ncbi:MAG: SUF system NifU family Fe-S cluster assembly protein [Candidatus Lloydbacteria bacterium CG22_combo_CG10-13_8_21_14_all_47_15]|uniref:SUF system NifU family Fe-S cluster assembly protein n=1 Tax=Candidatus Lloydbacteria bacterium CG22_combo_CG10-13_8_21_14_all_47_15 TaxID=1974635 RepID=A0A2H0CUC2_9BACT|nr:MAG: SUF system NifU family Fe-S cluster assembly protein [Candidatus Lloydbacteria bacterium CG22_combo_CG10-13_8_21_14_all_47_15]
MTNLYKEHILDHYRNPRHKKPLNDFDIKENGVNPSCGDALVLYLKFSDDGRVSDVGFDGEGCAISQASMSLLTDMILGRTREELSAIGEKDVFSLLGVSIEGARVKCALLPLETLQSALRRMESRVI